MALMARMARGAGIVVGGELFSRVDPGSRFLVAFLPVSIAGEPARHEHTALAWSTPEELAAFPLAPTVCGFVEHLLARGGDGAWLNMEHYTALASTLLLPRGADHCPYGMECR